MSLMSHKTIRIQISTLVACLWLATSSLQGKIVFHSDRGGNWDIYTMNSDGSNQKKLTKSHATDASANWSPNGQQIAFDRRLNDKYYVTVMDADGSNERRLTRGGSPDWSPDGSLVVFNSNMNRDKEHRLNIFVMHPDGTNIKQLTKFSFVSRPKWSPDGKRIAFEGFVENTREVYIMNADGTNVWRVSEPQPRTGMFLGGWSPDSKQLLYAESIEAKADKATLVIATLDPFGRNLVRKRERINIPGMPIYGQSWGADGKSILFASKPAFHRHIYRLRLTDGKIIQLTDGLGNDSGAKEWNPRLSVASQLGGLPLFWGGIKSHALAP